MRIACSLTHLIMLNIPLIFLFVTSSIYHRHIEHFFHIFGGSTVFSLISESTR